MPGAYSFTELKEALYTAADPSYLAPIFEAPYGNGKELFEALIAVFQRVDEGINRTLQSFFIAPWSGQTAPPAMGGSRAQIILAVQRVRRSDIALTLGAGSVLVGEVARDWSEDGGVEVATGREYTLTTDLTFLPGEQGPKFVPVVALTVGYGFANPVPGTIKQIFQPGATFQNNQATVVQGPSVARLTAQEAPDTFVPAHVGQYVQLTSGANVGQVRRIVGYEAALPGNGGTVLLAATFVGRALLAAPVGTFEIGETVQQIDTVGPVTVATGVVLAVSDVAPWYVVVETTAGAFTTTAGTIGPITGVLSGATFTVEDVTQQGQLANETGTAGWQILAWDEILGVTISNEPGTTQTPGAFPILDALGGERGMARAPGEDDETYRARILQVADLVSPNAIRRIGNRIWSPFMGQVCLREVGLALFPGLMCDTPPGATLDIMKHAYDLDSLRMRGAKTGEFFDGERVYQDNGGILAYARATSTLFGAVPAGSAAPPGVMLLPGTPTPSPVPNQLEIANISGKFVVGLLIVGEVSGATFLPGAISGGLRPQDRFKTNLDYTDFRAYFEVGVPKVPFGEFGIPFDAPHPYNAFDASPFLTFSDGFPLTAAVLNRTTWQAIDRSRAGGVGFTLYSETIGCF